MSIQNTKVGPNEVGLNRFTISLEIQFKGILSTKIVIFSYPKLLSFSILIFIK